MPGKAQIKNVTYSIKYSFRVNLDKKILSKGLIFAGNVLPNILSFIFIMYKSITLSYYNKEKFIQFVIKHKTKTKWERWNFRSG